MNYFNCLKNKSIPLLKGNKTSTKGKIAKTGKIPLFES
jgi:hypothetical protein